MTDNVLSTPLAEVAAADSPSWTDFAGFRMPLQFGGIVAEHMAVRQSAGLFDISHMGRLQLVGPHAESAAQRLVTRNIVNMSVDAVRYSFICDAEGRIIDDLMVTRLDAGWQLVVNASNRVRVLRQIRQAGYENMLRDLTFETAMLALQGPQATALLEQVWPESDARSRKRYRLWSQQRGNDLLTSARSGYTGEDGFEIFGPAAAVSQLWRDLRAAGATPCGLGSRDSLRNEAALPLYGHELREDTSPWELGLEYAVDLTKPFIGRDEMQRRYDAGVHQRRVGLVLAGRRIAREEMDIYCGERKVGRVTSGTWSPVRQQAIAQAYVEVECASLCTELEIDIRGRREKATVVGLDQLKQANAKEQCQ